FSATDLSICVVPRLSVGHVPWLWTAGAFHLGMCIPFYQAMDTLCFTAILKFAEGYSSLLPFYSIQPFSPVPFPVVLSVLFSILALFSCQKSLLEGLYQLFFAMSQGVFQGGTQGVQAAIFIVSAGITMIPTGQGYFKALPARMQSVSLRVHNKELHSPHLGYSKYADAKVLGHACSVLAAFAITATVGDRNPLSVLILPWVVMAVAFAQDKTFESTGLTRYGDLYGDTRGFNLAAGIISFMLFNCLVTAATLFLNVAWFVYALTFQLILISFLLDAVGALPFGYDIGVTIIFGLVSFYCFLENIFNSTFQSPQIPLGRPRVKLSGVGGGEDISPRVPARKATSVQQIAEIMKNGGICGMPTDTVYVLVAACNRPDAVVKKQAQDRSMSLWISSIKQLESVRHLLSPLVLDFTWLSSISMVIPRRPWMDMFGLGDAAKHKYRYQKPRLSLPFLFVQVGPIAVTSANPTGKADTTYHNQVYVAGLSCDGPSPENTASTVVDCTKIETEHIGFFRVGLIPKSKVLEIFEEVQRRHRQGQKNPAFEYDLHLPDTQTEQSSGEDDTAESGSRTGNSTPFTVSPEQSPALRTSL
uniref:Threonylcarbamoyl-AMP synthase n=1 Tax=Amphiprion percula TaxID=161767 RepID=A0A3P8TIL1_AMPPE